MGLTQWSQLEHQASFSNDNKIESHNNLHECLSDNNMQAETSNVPTIQILIVITIDINMDFCKTGTNVFYFVRKGCLWIGMRIELHKFGNS